MGSRIYYLLLGGGLLIAGSDYNILKAIFYLLKGDYRAEFRVDSSGFRDFRAWSLGPRARDLRVCHLQGRIAA